jgi:hypothetical protein
MMQDTSIDAYHSVDHKSLEKKVLSHLALYADGATCDELEIAMNGRHQSISATLTHAKKKRFIVDSGERRPTRSGRQAIVWELNNNKGDANEI